MPELGTDHVVPEKLRNRTNIDPRWIDQQVNSVEPYPLTTSNSLQIVYLYITHHGVEHHRPLEFLLHLGELNCVSGCETMHCCVQEVNLSDVSKLNFHIEKTCHHLSSSTELIFIPFHLIPFADARTWNGPRSS